MPGSPPASLALSPCPRAKEESPPSSTSFVYPPLDHSKSQFRVLQLAPGDPDDEITATIAIYSLRTLPDKYDDEPHLSELKAISEHLATAISTGTEVQLEELLRWERLHTELNEAYMMTFWDSWTTTTDSVPLPKTILRMKEMRTHFIDQLQRFQSISCEVDALQALINRLESIFPRSTSEEERWEPDPQRCRFYIAVSYCCGDQTIQELITLNNARVQIPASAARALRALRKRDLSLPFWIDALCIDPSNPKERSHQVLLMSKIYSTANHVLVRLENESESVIDLLLASELKLQHLRSCGPIQYDPGMLFEADSDISESLRDAGREYLALLLVYLKQPWFSRLWVYQEVLLSQEVWFHLGRLVVTWSYIRTAIEYYERFPLALGWRNGVNVNFLGPASPWCRRSLFDSTDIRSNSAQENIPFKYTPPSLTELLLDTIPLKCLDPRDKVYALLGLTSWSTQKKTLPAELEPDYTLPVGECMRNATLAAIRENTSLQCLTLPVWTKRKPSWVVPWHELEFSRNVSPDTTTAFQYDVRSLMPDCSGGRIVNMDILRQPNKLDSLFLEGYRVGRILQMSTAIELQDVEGLCFELRLRKVLQGLLGLLEGCQSQSSDITVIFMLALWRRVLEPSAFDSFDFGDTEALQKDVTAELGEKDVEDHVALGEQSRCHPDEGRRLRRLIDRLQVESHTTLDHESSLVKSSTKWNARYTDELDCSILNSRFYMHTVERSRDVRLITGYGPKDIQIGDEVIMLHGSKAPVVLRPEQSWWLWVGPSLPFMPELFTASCSEDAIEVFEIQRGS